MQKISFGQPCKQNENNFQQSPHKKRKGEALIQILKYLKSNSIALPVHIQKLLKQSPESPLKQSALNIKQQTDSKKLKVQLSECQFELKKIQEDFAEFKRNIKNQKEKQSKKHEELLFKLKNQISNLNEDGSYLLDKQKQQFSLQIKNLKQKSKLQLEQAIKGATETFQVKLDNQQKLSRRQIHELHRTYDAKTKSSTEKYEEEIYKLKAGHQNQVKELNIKNKFVLDQRERKYESVRLALESQRKTQEKLHQKTKLQANKQKQKLITQLCFANNVIKQLSQEIQINSKEMKRLKSIIKDQEITLQLKEQKFKRKFEQFEQELNEKYKTYENKQKEAIIKLNQAQIKEIENFQQRLNDMENIHNEREDMLAKNTEEMACFFEKRPSKKQDLSEIQKLKWALTKRQDEVRKLNREIKNCNLELENKEDIYTRMFRGNSLSRQKKYSTKDDREKQQVIIEQKLMGKDPVFRKSHTSDLKFLLKVYTNKCTKLD